MAILRNPINADNTVSYVATLAFFCCVSCVTLMLKFGGFKASLNFYHGKKKNKELDNGSTEISMNGAYRTNRDEFFGYSHYAEPQRKLTPAVRPAPTEQVERPLRPAKSTSDLVKSKNLPPNLRQSNPNISQDPRGVEQVDNRNDRNQEPKKLDAEKRLEKKRVDEQKKLEKQRVEEQKKLEKQRAEEQKKRDKQAAQDQARQEKLRKEQEKRDAQQAKRDKKKKAPAPTKPLANPLAQGNSQQQYATNTLESSISRSSGPPPYADVPQAELVQNEADSSGNVSFSKPIDTGSWDLVSQHRQQINRPVNTTPDRKQVVMDLKYNMADSSTNESKENSEA